MKTDYNPEEVRELSIFLHQFIPHERNPVYKRNLEKIHAIIQGVDMIGLGTNFIKNRAEEEFHANT